MITKALTKIFGSRNSRLLKRMQQDVLRINAFEPELAKLTDEQLRAKTAEFKTRVSNGESLDNLLHEALHACARRPSAHWACVISTCS